MTRISWIASVAVGALATRALAQPQFYWVPKYSGSLYSQGASSVSDDGLTTAGTLITGNILNHVVRAFRSTSALGTLAISVPGDAWGEDMSADGSVIVGSHPGGGFQWRLSNPATGSGVAAALNPPGVLGAFGAISADGSTCTYGAASGPHSLFRWTEETEFTPVQTPAGHAGLTTGDLSTDGSVIVGTATAASSPATAFRWFLTNPQTGEGVTTTLGILPGFMFSRATGVSGDGSVVVGVCDSGDSSPAMPFRWTLSNPATGAGVMAAIPVGSLGSVVVSAVSADGTVIIGTVQLTGGSADGAVVWTPQDGWRRLDSVLSDQYALIAPTWTMRRSVDISSDGRSILGGGSGGPSSASTNWVARLPSAPCYADCNADGVLTVADFGCFQSRFVAASPYADCNGDGTRTVADFGCFQSKFPLGCP